jgi:hypothetical protein
MMPERNSSYPPPPSQTYKIALVCELYVLNSSIENSPKPVENAGMKNEQDVHQSVCTH